MENVFKGALKLPMDEHLVQKTLRILNTQTIDETLLDELQAKVCSYERLNWLNS